MKACQASFKQARMIDDVHGTKRRVKLAILVLPVVRTPVLLLFTFALLKYRVRLVIPRSLHSSL